MFGSYKARAVVGALMVAASLGAISGQAVSGRIRYAMEGKGAAVTAAPPITARKATSARARYAVTLPNCESRVRTVPCVTFDEAQWRIVWGYRPYTYQQVRKCRTVTGSGPLPCVVRTSGEQFRVYASSVEIG